MIYIDKPKKNIQFLFSFIQKDEIDVRAHRFLLSRMLFTPNEIYKTKKDINKKINYFYKTSPRVLTNLYGDYFITRVFFMMPTEDLVEKNTYNEFFDFLKSLIFTRKSFDLKNFEFEKNNIISDIKSLKEDKFTYGKMLYNEFSFGKNSELTYPVTGKIKDLEKVSLEDIEKTYDSFIHNSDKHLIINGHVSEEIIQKIHSFADFNDSKKYNLHNNNRKIAKYKLKEVTTKMQQANIYIGYHAFSEPFSKRQCALQLGQIVLGGYENSRLFKIIREKYNLCYFIRSKYKLGLNQIQITTSVSPKNVNDTINKIDEITNDFIINGISNEELMDAKRVYISSLIADSDNPFDNTQRAFDVYFYGELQKIEEKIKQIEEVTLKDVNEAIKTLSKERVFVLKGQENEED